MVKKREVMFFKARLWGSGGKATSRRKQ